MEEVIKEQDTAGNAKLVYILYLVGLVVGVTGIIGVVMAYLNRNEAQDWLATHYQFQIRTFWIGALFMLLGGLTAIFFIGYFVMLFWIVWLVVRCIKGMKYLDQQAAHPAPKAWLF